MVDGGYGMSSPFSHLYTQDVFGRRVLVGLTYAETQELERLDAQPPTDETGHLMRWETEEDEFSPCHARWLELYKKHQAACARLRED